MKNKKLERNALAFRCLHCRTVRTEGEGLPLLGCGRSPLCVRLVKIVILCMGLLSLTHAAQAAPSLDVFFKPAPDRGADLPKDELYPRGRQLMMSMYSVVSPQVERSKADGFTCIGPYYGAMDKSDPIGKAKAAGVKCIYSVGKRVKFVGDKYTMPTDEEIRAPIIEAIKKVGRHREIAVWNVTCEELRYWRKDEMHWLDVATKAIREADPLKRPIMMYDPNHRDANALAHTVKYLDFSSKGMYANMAGMKDCRVWIRWGVEQEIKAIETANPKAIPVSVLLMSRDPKDPAEDELIDDWTRHDVYVSMVAGAKGITIWSGWKGRRGFQRTFKKFYAGYSSAAKELNGELGLAQVFLFGEPRKDIRLAVESGPATVRMEYKKVVKVYPSVSHADLAYGNARYLFLVNSADEPGTLTVSGLPASGVRGTDVLDGAACRIENGRLRVSLPMLGVKCFRFERK